MRLKLSGGRLKSHLVSARVDFVDIRPVVKPHVWPEAIAMQRNVAILALLRLFDNLMAVMAPHNRGMLDGSSGLSPRMPRRRLLA